MDWKRLEYIDQIVKNVGCDGYGKMHYIKIGTLGELHKTGQKADKCKKCCMFGSITITFSAQR